MRCLCCKGQTEEEKKDTMVFENENIINNYNSNNESSQLKIQYNELLNNNKQLTTKNDELTQENKKLNDELQILNSKINELTLKNNEMEVNNENFQELQDKYNNIIKQHDKLININDNKSTNEELLALNQLKVQLEELETELRAKIKEYRKITTDWAEKKQQLNYAQNDLEKINCEIKQKRAYLNSIITINKQANNGEIKRINRSFSYFDK